MPSRYNSSRAKCIKCCYCGVFLSPNKFVFHSHRVGESDKYVQPDAANFNSWRRHTKLLGDPPEVRTPKHTKKTHTVVLWDLVELFRNSSHFLKEIVHAWEDIKAMFNGGTRKRVLGDVVCSAPPPPPPPPVMAAAAASTSTSAAAAAAAAAYFHHHHHHPFPFEPLVTAPHLNNNNPPTAAASKVGIKVRGITVSPK